VSKILHLNSKLLLRKLQKKF